MLITAWFMPEGGGRMPLRPCWNDLHFKTRIVLSISPSVSFGLVSDDETETI